MPIKTSCSQCQANFELPDRLAGKTVRCQKCQATFKVPELPVEPVQAETQPLNPVAAVDPPKPADDVVVATMVGPPPVEKDEEIVMGKLAEPADTAPKSKPTPSPRSRRPTPEPTGNTGAGAIIAVIVIGLFACLLLAGGGGAAVFFLALRPAQEKKAVKPRRDFDDKKGWDFDKGGKGKWDWDGGKKWDDKPGFDNREITTPAPKTEPFWKDEPKKTEKIDFTPIGKTENPRPIPPKTTEAPKTDVPDKTAKLSRIEDLPANERVFWQGIEFGTKNNIPGRIISPIPPLHMGVRSATSDGVAVFQGEMVAGKRVNVGMTSTRPLTVQVHDGDIVIAKGTFGPFSDMRDLGIVLSIVPRKTGRHAIFVTTEDRLQSDFTMEIRLPNRTVDPVSFGAGDEVFVRSSLALDSNINPRMEESSFGLCREFVVDMQTSYTYTLKSSASSFIPRIQIESPDGKCLKVGEINRGFSSSYLDYRPTMDGKHHVFVAAGRHALGSFGLLIKRTKIE